MNLRFSTRCAATAIGVLAVTTAQAQSTPGASTPNEGMRYATVGVQRDAQGNQQVLSALSLTAGKNAWVQVGGGQSHSQIANVGHSPSIFTGGLGLANDSLQFTLNATERRDGSGYHQTDWASALDWRLAAGQIGVDATHRRSQAEGTVPTASPQGGTAYVPVQEGLSGSGFGVHGGLKLGDKLTVYAAALRNHYATTTRQNGNVTTSGSVLNPDSLAGGLLANQPLLARALLARASLVNRDEAALDRSAQFGASYRWSSVALTGEYTTDRVHDGGGTLHSVTLKAAVDVAPGWRVTPGFGRSQSDQGDRVNFAMLSATYGW